MYCSLLTPTQQYCMRLILIALFINALFAAIFSFSQIALLYGPPFFIVALRMLLGGSLIFTYLLFFKRSALTIAKSQLWPILLLAIFNIYFTNAYELWGLQYLSAAKAGFIYNLSPFISAILAYCFLGERMTKGNWLGIFIGFIGFVPVFMNESIGEQSLNHFFIFSTAELSLFLATGAMAYGWITMQKIIQKREINTLAANALSMLLGGLIALGHSYCIEPWGPGLITNWFLFIKWILLITILANLIIYPLYTHCLKYYTATFMTFTGFTCPLFAVIYDWLLFKIAAPQEFYWAIVMVFVGWYIYHYYEKP